MVKNGLFPKINSKEGSFSCDRNGMQQTNDPK
jgi:hypothetical protein